MTERQTAVVVVNVLFWALVIVLFVYGGASHHDPNIWDNCAPQVC